MTAVPAADGYAPLSHPSLSIVPAPPRPPLTVAVRWWPLALSAAASRPLPRLDEVLWRPQRRLPDWLGRYLLVELPVRATQLPATPSPFRAGLAAVPSCLAVQGVLAGLHHADAPHAWQCSAMAAPTFTYRKAGGTITTSVHPPRDRARADVAVTALWDTVKDFRDLDGDVLLSVLAHALDRTEPDGTTWITADAILDDRGIRPKTERAGTVRYRAGYRREDRARIAACMERLERLWVGLRDVTLMEVHPDRGARPRRMRLTHESDGRAGMSARLVSGRPRRARLTQEDTLLLILERLMQDGLPIAWRYRPGSWLDPFLARPNRQTALLARQVLRYDPYRERWEKRLARYATFHLRMDAKRAAPLVRRIGPLLDELNLPMDQRHPERTRARFERALGRLTQDGVIGAWAYTPAAQDILASLPARQWIETWRGLTIALRPASAVAAHYAALATVAHP